MAPLAPLAGWTINLRRLLRRRIVLLTVALIRVASPLMVVPFRVLVVR